MIDKAVRYLQENAQTLAATALTTLTSVGSLVVTLVLALVFAFFMLKDGPRFIPWLRHWIGDTAGNHIDTVAGRVWKALGQYVWSQAAVAAIDGIFIGVGVWFVGVPLVLPIAFLTFVGGFIPIVGAFAAGAVAVLVALFSKGVWAAVIVLGIVLVVQQLEGNVFQPMLVSKTLEMHPGVVLGGVAIGGTLFGITGAFLAVPAISVLMVVSGYLREQVMHADGRAANDTSELSAS